ncbi:DUF3048 domain-containing protein [Bacillus sp. SM2101]|uniref:DUF3048 domain-containing protein n=1 Tax=Bacillus sp. SM2101 TaxID=2805366 RepID=UPI001BDEEE8C|nr:DUF3048 domain-containing protein [Bacillus sp. SM2101]
MRVGKLGMAVLLGIAITGCSNEDEQVVKEAEEITEQVEEEVDETSTTVVEEEQFEYNYPLTGIGTNDESVHQRAVAVMVNNHPNARPQTGLNQADLVYEMLTEGDITRLLAFYQSDIPAKVGPVRSARHDFIELSDGYDALYVYHGTYTILEQKLRNGLIDNISGSYHDNDGTVFERANYRKAPHNSFLLFDGLNGVATDRYNYSVTNEAGIPPLPFMSDDEEISGDDVQSVMITYSNSYYATVEYVYDQMKEKYTRFTGEDQTKDFESDIPVLIDNIMIVEMDHQIIDEVGRRDINLQSGGKGYLLQKGKLQEIDWQNVDGRILPYKEGQYVKFLPGKTWINIIPTSPGLAGDVSTGNE